MAFITKSYLATQFTNFATRVASVFVKKNELTENAIIPIISKSYNGLYASSNTNGSGSDFMPIILTPNNANDIWKIKFRISGEYTNSDSNFKYTQSSIVEFGSSSNVYATHRIYNSIRNEDYRPYYYGVVYRPNGSTSSFYMGFSLHNCNNNTSASNARNVTIDLLDYENCTVELRDTCANTDYDTYYKNMNSRDTYNCYNKGVKMYGDGNDVTTLRPSTGVYVAGGTSGQVGIYGYNLIMQDAEGKFQSLTKANTVGTTKEVRTTVGFNPRIIYLYWSNNNVNYGSSTLTNSCRYASDWIDARNLFNCGTTLTTNEFIYLKGKIIDGLFYISQEMYSQSLPTTEDGYVYCLIGRAYENKSMSVNLLDIRWLHYKNGKIREYNDETLATSEYDGLMSKADKVKLDGIQPFSRLGNIWKVGEDLYVAGGEQTVTTLTSPNVYIGDMYLNSKYQFVYQCIGVTSTNSTWKYINSLKGGSLSWNGTNINVASGEQTVISEESGGVNVYTFTLFDGSTSTLKVKNGVSPQEVSLIGTLEQGETSLTIEDERITTDGTYDYYTDVYGVSPTDVEIENGIITMEFEEQEYDLGVKVVIK